MSSETVERVFAPKKVEYCERLVRLTTTYQKILIVDADNVTSKQMQQVRNSLRGRAELIMGKNTMIRRVIRANMEEHPKLANLLPHIQGNIGLMFTDEDPAAIREVMTANKVAAPARGGAIAPCDVVVPAGSTGLEPTMTSFFQALNINTKIARGSIEIISDVHLIHEGDKVTMSQATLLQKLKIMPFAYSLRLVTIYDDGEVYGAEVLDITDDDIAATFSSAIANVASFSLAADYPTLASLPHSFVNGYKDLVAICLETDYCFPAAEDLKNRVNNPELFAAAAPAATEAAAPAAAAPAAAEESDSDSDMGMGLFD